MPEGPEAHTMAAKLHSMISNLYILSINHIERMINTNIDEISLPIKILNVSAYGKRPIFTLENGYIVSFLSMTGRWSFTKDKDAKMELELGTSTMMKLGNQNINIIDVTSRIYYCGQGSVSKSNSLCGKVSYMRNQADLNIYFSSYGPDMLASPPKLETYTQIIKSVKAKHQYLCVFLLEQEYVSGVGNYLRSDIMYHSRLHPMRLVSSLTNNEISNLYNSTILLMRLSFHHGGMSFSDYIDPYGEKGTYPRLVYRMKHDPTNQKVSVLDAPDGRKVYWVEQVQQ